MMIVRDLKGEARRQVAQRYPLSEGGMCRNNQHRYGDPYCTRPDGHRGLHVAHTARNNAIMTWRAHDDFLGWLEEQEEGR